MEIKETKSEVLGKKSGYQNVKENETQEKDENQKVLLDALTQMEQERERIKKAFRGKKKISYNPGRDMAALTNASKSAQVRMISARLRSEMVRIKRMGSGSREAACAVAKIKKMLEKAEVKTRKLIVEEQIEGERQKAEKKRELERAKELAKELSLKRKKRKQLEEQDMMEFRQGRGVNYVSEAEIDMELRCMNGTVQTETAVETVIGGETASYSENDVSGAGDGSTSVDIML